MSRIRHNPQIVVSQTTIGIILRTSLLKVPPHQREYRWTDMHVQTLFEDLHRAITSDASEYFLGTIVTIPDEMGMLAVIDGQQRLATITILLAQIRSYLRPIEPEMAESLTPFLTEFDRSQRTAVPKLRLNLADNDFFSKTLAAPSLPPSLPATAPVSNKRLLNAFMNAQNYIKRIVAPANRNTHGDELNKWIDFIEHNAEVILLQVPTGANAYKMFETLNDRGLKTTQADLVKNYLFGKASDRYPEAQEAWSSMTGALVSVQGEDDEKEDVTVLFLRCALIAMQGFLRKNEVYEVIQSIAKGAPAVITLLKELEDLAGVYTATFYQDHEKWNQFPDTMRHAIQTINDFDVKPFRPILLSVAAKFTPKEAAKAFQMFVSLGVRLLITSSTRGGAIEDSIPKAANKVFKGEITTAKDLKAEITNIIPSDKAFNHAFQIASVSKASFARYFLRAMEKTVQSGPFPWYVPNDDKEVMSLEHVLPQHPEDNWPAFNAQEVDFYHKRLGNMCLLPTKPNNDLKSADQKIKYAVYQDSPYTLTKQIAAVARWTPAAIEERQKELAKLAVKTWSL